MHNILSHDSADAYESMLEKLDQIEVALINQHDVAPIECLTRDIESCLEKMKRLDSQADQLANDSRRSLVEKILKKNMAITTRIQQITALHRAELAQIKKGLETAKGYASYRSSKTGALINSAT